MAGRGFSSFAEAVGGDLHRSRLEILQINVGKLCNQTCSHCHVDAGPRRTEIMTEQTARAAMALLDRVPTFDTVDITGGAPEMNPNFRWMVLEARQRGKRVIDRCNLTILLQDGYEDLGTFLAENEVEITASLPCYLEENVDKQRGKGVFAESIEALRLLNSLGYGTGGRLQLNLVYNPTGLGLPGPQEGLERDYKAQLGSRFGITFDRLLTITNMPIQRFERWLRATGQFDAYQSKIEGAFNPATVAGLMCRNTLSIGWDGVLYDCDFNQMLDMSIRNGHVMTVGGFDEQTLASLPIRTARHCFGCTAGAGSSCGGALMASA